MLPRFAKESVSVIRAGQKIVRGETVPDWSTAKTHTVTRCLVQPASTSRNFASARILNTDEAWTLYAQPGADIQAGDRITWNGKTFEVDGVAEEWTSPTGRVSNAQYTLRRWAG